MSTPHPVAPHLALTVETQTVTTIWKFSLAIDDDVWIDMPIGAEVLHVAVQGQSDNPRTASLYLWARVGPHAESERRHFRVAGTGHPLEGGTPDPLVYIGTFQLAGGALVFHVFEVIA